MPTGERLDRVLKQTLIFAALLAVLGFFRWLIFEIGVVTSDSMQPTLQKGDVLLLDHRKGQTRQRGQVVLFKPPDSWPPLDTKDEQLVKRIVGLPGETVQFGLGKVMINGQVLTEDYLKPVDVPDDGRITTLGPDEYYVLGDNRDNSDDSRSHGPIKGENITSRVVSVIYPFSHFGSLTLPAY